MACNICSAVVIYCDYCGDGLGSAFFCFEDEDGSHHFCSGLCFDLWIVEENKNQLEDAEQDSS